MGDGWAAIEERDVGKGKEKIDSLEAVVIFDIKPGHGICEVRARATMVKESLDGDTFVFTGQATGLDAPVFTVTSVNAWEDLAFLLPVEARGRLQITITDTSDQLCFKCTDKLYIDQLVVYCE